MPGQRHILDLGPGLDTDGRVSRTGTPTIQEEDAKPAPRLSCRRKCGLGCTAVGAAALLTVAYVLPAALDRLVRDRFEKG